jgi:hypothetical protein
MHPDTYTTHAATLERVAAHLGAVILPQIPGLWAPAAIIVKPNRHAILVETSYQDKTKLQFIPAFLRRWQPIEQQQDYDYTAPRRAPTIRLNPTRPAAALAADITRRGLWTAAAAIATQDIQHTQTNARKQSELQARLLEIHQITQTHAHYGHGQDIHFPGGSLSLDSTARHAHKITLYPKHWPAVLQILKIIAEDQKLNAIP